MFIPLFQHHLFKNIFFSWIAFKFLCNLLYVYWSSAKYYFASTYVSLYNTILSWLLWLISSNTIHLILLLFKTISNIVYSLHFHTNFRIRFSISTQNICGKVLLEIEKWKSLSFLLCNPRDCSLPHSTVHGILQGRILERVAILFSRDLPNPGIQPRSPTLQADSLPSEPSGKPKNTGVGSLSLLQQIFPTQELNRVLLHFRQILYQLSYQGSP